MTISFAALLTQPSTPVQVHQGWLELPDGKRCQPHPVKVRFIPGRNKPVITHSRLNYRKRLRRWWAELMGLRG